jgi:pimeloyl-ACP methyl ester carboxylesterase
MTTIAALRRRGRATSADGTEIAYYVLGRGPRTWLAAPAMGAPLIAMSHVYAALADELTVITWDMRGFHGSAAPRDRTAYDVARHVEDLEAVARAERLGRFVLGGWSMGVAISLEYASRRRGDVEALVLINGPYASALAHALPVPGAAAALDAALGALGRPVGHLMNPLARRVLGAPGLARMLHRSRILARHPELFEDVLAEFKNVDWSRYLVVLERLHGYSAEAHLARLDVPTLITVGSRDWMTPPSVGRAMHARIAGSELAVIEGGTHYTPIEFPELLSERIRAFLARFPEGARAA